PVFGKEIRILWVGGVASDKIGARNLHNPGVIPIGGQHSRTKREKRTLRQAIVFENNAIFFLVEEPGNGFAHRNLTPEVSGSEQCFYVALPIDVSGQELPYSVHFFLLA